MFSGGEGRERVWVIEVASLRWEPGVLGAVDVTKMGWVEQVCVGEGGGVSVVKSLTTKRVRGCQ